MKSVLYQILCMAILFNFLFLGVACKNAGVDPPPPSGPDTTTHDFLWSADTIGTFQSSLRDAWGTDANNVYAVGFVHLPNRPLPTNIMHWNGTQWEPIDFSEGGLLGIHGFASSDIWVVGEWGVQNALISHWDGTQWRVWRLQQYPNLIAVWGTSSGNVFACGASGTILHYDGSAWTSMNTGTTHTLYGIFGIQNDVYAVGGDPSTGIGVVLKYRGGSWKIIYERPYNPDSLSGRVSAVWGAAIDRFYIDTFEGHDSTWQRLQVPDDNTYIENTFGTQNNNIFMVGHFGLIIHFSGRSWWRYDQIFRKPGEDVLFGVWCDTRSAFVVGRTNGARAIVFRGKR